MDIYFNVSDASAVQKTQNINFVRTWTFNYDPVLKESDQNCPQATLACDSVQTCNVWQLNIQQLVKYGTQSVCFELHPLCDLDL